MKSLDEREETKYIRDLRKENSKLRKEISAMKKKNNRLENLVPDDDELPPPIAKEIKDILNPCPKCDSKKVELVIAGIFEILICSNCGAKSKTMK